MNNLYTKLGVEAGLLTEEYNGFDRMVLDNVEKKLVELTVRECVRVLSLDDGATHHEELLYKHFGIDE